MTMMIYHPAVAWERSRAAPPSVHMFRGVSGSCVGFLSSSCRSRIELSAPSPVFIFVLTYIWSLDQVKGKKNPVAMLVFLRWRGPDACDTRAPSASYLAIIS